MTDKAPVPERRLARRGGILTLAMVLPMLGSLGVTMLALSSLTPIFVPTGICLILFAALSGCLGVVALRGSGPIGQLRVAVGAVAVIGVFAVVTTGLVVPPADTGGQPSPAPSA